MTNIKNEIMNGIKNYIDIRLKKIDFGAKIKNGIIVSIENDNEYGVKIDNVVYDNIPALNGYVYQVNNIVKVITQNSNDLNNIFILGRLG